MGKKEKWCLYASPAHLRSVLAQAGSGIRAARKGRRNAYSHPSPREISSSKSQKGVLRPKCGL